MFNYFKFAAVLLLVISVVPKGHAYSTVMIELSNKSGDTIEHKVSIDGRWLRIDSKPKAKADYVLLDTGFHKYYDVYENDKNYQLTHVGRLYWPETTLLSPKFKLAGKSKAVGSMRCQPVNEIGEDQNPIAEHCMATGSELGLNAREMTTLSRLLTIMRRTSGSLDKSWIGAATSDERQISIQSEDSAGNRMAIRSVSHEKLDYTLLKIPTDYKEITPALPVEGQHHSEIPHPPNFRPVTPDNE